MNKYFYLDSNDNSVGPLTREELNKLSETRQISSDTFIVEEGGAEWKPYGTLPTSQTASLPAKPPPVLSEARLIVPSIYLLIQDKQEGPYTEAQVRQYLAEGRITNDLLACQEPLTEWVPVSSLITLSSPPSHTPMTAVALTKSTHPSPHVRIKSFETLYQWYWILLAAGVPLCFLLIGVPAVITALVLFFMLLYRFWDLIQDIKPRTTPGKAVGFMFIPFFNVYWQFVMFYGLAQEFNRYTRERAIATPRINEGRALTFCILNCFAFIPFVNLLLSIPVIIIVILVMRDFKNTSVAILRSKQ